jgi:hypothetical protein
MDFLVYPFPGYVHYILAGVLFLSLSSLSGAKNLIREFRSRGALLLGFEQSNLFAKMSIRRMLVVGAAIANIVLGAIGNECVLLWLGINVAFISSTLNLGHVAEGIILAKAQEEIENGDN